MFCYPYITIYKMNISALCTNTTYQNMLSVNIGIIISSTQAISTINSILAIIIKI